MLGGISLCVHSIALELCVHSHTFLRAIYEWVVWYSELVPLVLKFECDVALNLYRKYFLNHFAGADVENYHLGYIVKKTWLNLIKHQWKAKAHRAYTYRNPKRHIPPVSLLLWHNVMAMHCFISALGLRLWSVRRNFTFSEKFYIQPPVSDFVFLKMYFMLDGLILFHKGDFRSEVCH